MSYYRAIFPHGNCGHIHLTLNDAYNCGLLTEDYTDVQVEEISLTNTWTVRFGGREFSYCRTELMNKLVNFCILHNYAVEVSYNG